MLRLIRNVTLTALVTVPAISQPQVFVSNAARSATGAAAESSASFRGPVMGFAFDAAANRFVPLLGIPGAATHGRSVLPDQPLKNVEVAGSQDFALAVAGSSSTPAVVALRADSAATTSVSGADSAPDRIFLSSAGTAGILYYQATRKLQVVTGFPASPSVSRELTDLHTGAEVTAAAVSDDGANILLGLWDGQAGSLYRLTADGAEDLVLSAGRISAVAFLEDSGSVLAADRDNSRIYLLQLTPGAVQSSLLADAMGGISSPRTLASSADHRKVFVLNGDATLSVLDVGGGAPLSLSCSCRPSGLLRLAGNDVFRLTDLSADPTWILAAGDGTPRLFFIPATVQPEFQMPTPTKVTQ